MSPYLKNLKKVGNYEYKISYKFIENAEVIKITSSASEAIN